MLHIGAVEKHINKLLETGNVGVEEEVYTWSIDDMTSTLAGGMMSRGVELSVRFNNMASVFRNQSMTRTGLWESLGD